MKIPPFNLIFFLCLMLSLNIGGCTDINSNAFKEYSVECTEANCVHPLDISNLNSLNSAEITRIEFVRQSDQTGCGAAVLSAVMTYWGRSTSYSEIISNFPQRSKSGYSIGELRSIASKKNFISFSLPMTENFLKKQLKRGRPIILPVKKYALKVFKIYPEFLPFLEKLMYSHYLVIFGFNDNGYWAMDPAIGYIYLDSNEFIKMWKRQQFVGLLITPNPN